MKETPPNRKSCNKNPSADFVEGMDDPERFAQAAEINASAQEKGSSHVDTAATEMKGE